MRNDTHQPGETTSHMMSNRTSHNKMKLTASCVMVILLLSLVVFTHNSFINIAYANNNSNDNKNNEVKNKSLIADMSDQVASLGTNKRAVQQVIQQIQSQIAQTSGQDKATKTIKQINAIVGLNPNGPLSQSILSLAKQQTTGNTAAVNQAATQIAKLVASGSDYVGKPLEQSGTSSSPLALSPPPIPQSPSPITSGILSTTSPKQQSAVINPQQIFIQPGSSNNSNARQSSNRAVTLTAPNSQSRSLFPANNNFNNQNSLTNGLSTTLAIPSTSNTPPVADASHRSPDQIVDEGSAVTLDGSASFSHDPANDPLTTFAWKQTAGPTVILTGANTAKATFTAPNVPSNTALKFQLTVTDKSGLSDPDYTHVIVRHVVSPPPQHPPPPTTDTPPVADASHRSPDQIVDEGSAVTLDGSASFSHDPANDPLTTFAWKQTAGPTVILTGANTAKATFTAPNVPSNTALKFQLTVTDKSGLSDPDYTHVIVRHVVSPPPQHPPPPTT